MPFISFVNKLFCFHFILSSLDLSLASYCHHLIYFIHLVEEVDVEVDEDLDVDARIELFNDHENMKRYISSYINVYFIIYFKNFDHENIS